MKWILLALLVSVVLSQTNAVYDTPQNGVCIGGSPGTDPTSPPNYSKNGISRTSCETQCNFHRSFCIGYSWGQNVQDVDAAGVVQGVFNNLNRCVIWINQSTISDQTGGAFHDWAGYDNYTDLRQWAPNSDKLSGGDGSNTGYMCYVRKDTCKAGVATSVSHIDGENHTVTMNHSEMDQGTSQVLQCNTGSYDSSKIGSVGGTVTVTCNETVVSVSGECQIALKSVQIWREMGPGLCRDTTLEGNGRSAPTGPGVSPPNFSRWTENDELWCRAQCSADNFKQLCIGYSYARNLEDRKSDKDHRCALWINTDPKNCGNRAGWEQHSMYADGAWSTTSEINGTSGDAEWNCVTYNPTGTVVIDYSVLSPNGVCSNSAGHSPANYSKNGVSFETCKNQCKSLLNNGTLKCLAFAYVMNNSRCAIYMDTTDKNTLDSVANFLPLDGGGDTWETHAGENAWLGDRTITQGDGEASSYGQFMCYEIVSRRKY
eukprot:UN22521